MVDGTNFRTSLPPQTLQTSRLPSNTESTEPALPEQIEGDPEAILRQHDEMGHIIQRPRLDFDIDIGGIFGQRQVAKATDLADQIANGNLSDADKAQATLEFERLVSGMDDNQRLALAKNLGDLMSVDGGNDETLNVLLQNVLKQVEPNNSMVRAIFTSMGRGDSEAVNHTKALIDDIVDGNRDDPENMARGVLQIEDNLENMSPSERMEVAQYLAQKMAESDGHDGVLNALFTRTIEKLEEPRNIFNIPDIDRVPLPRFPDWPGNPFPMDPEGHPEYPRDGLPGDFEPPSGRLPDWWPGTPPTFPWTDLPPDMDTFGGLRGHLEGDTSPGLQHPDAPVELGPDGLPVDTQSEPLTPIELGPDGLPLYTDYE